MKVYVPHLPHGFFSMSSCFCNIKDIFCLSIYLSIYHFPINWHLSTESQSRKKRLRKYDQVLRMKYVSKSWDRPTVTGTQQVCGLTYQFSTLYGAFFGDFIIEIHNMIERNKMSYLLGFHYTKQWEHKGREQSWNGQWQSFCEPKDGNYEQCICTFCFLE